MFRQKNLLSIRFMLAICLLLGLGVVSAAAQDQPVTLRIWAGQYTPSRVLPDTGDARIQGLDPIIEAYQALHPNVTIELIVQPNNSDDTRRWIITQLSGGTAPDIMWYQPDWAAEDYRRNWLLPLDPYLNQPNPYVADGERGSERWGDVFMPAQEVWRAADDELYVIIGDQVQVGIYYNMDIFAQAGVTEVPTTWEALMDAAQRIQEAGFFPFAQSANNLDQLTWVSGWLTNFYYAPEIPTYDADGNGVLSKVEMAQAVQAGTFAFDQPRNRARLEEMLRFSRYWQPGALGADMNTATRLFVTGRAGMLITGSWMYQTILQDEQRGFDFGVFYFPVLDSTTSSLIPDGVPPTNKAAGYGSFQFAVPRLAESRGTTEAAFDFLRFATAPQNISGMIVEAGFALPAVFGAEASPDLEPFAESISYPDAPFQEDDSMFDFEFAQKFLAITTPYFAGTQTLDETVQQLDVELRAAAGRVLQ